MPTLSSLCGKLLVCKFEPPLNSRICYSRLWPLLRSYRLPLAEPRSHQKPAGHSRLVSTPGTRKTRTEIGRSDRYRVPFFWSLFSMAAWTRFYKSEPFILNGFPWIALQKIQLSSPPPRFYGLSARVYRLFSLPAFDMTQA